MNFFKLYIGDYQRDSAHLSVTEHGAYLLMLQHYYATERPLPKGPALHRMLRAMSKVERDAIDAVANQFWVQTPEGLVNDRAGEEIGKANHQREVNREIGKRGGRPKRTETESVSKSVSESEPINNPNQTPDTRQIHNPPTPKGVAPPLASPPLPLPEPRPPAAPLIAAVAAPPPPKAKPPAMPCPEGVDAQVWADWLTLRRSKNAPVTATVLKGASSEAAKAGMPLGEFLAVWCARGSQGLQADWLRPDERPRAREAPAETAYQRSMRERVEQVCPSIAAKAPQSTPRRSSDVIDITPTAIAHRLG